LANVAARIRNLISRDDDRASAQVISVSLLPSIERGQEQTECDSTMNLALSAYATIKRSDIPLRGDSNVNWLPNPVEPARLPLTKCEGENWRKNAPNPHTQENALRIIIQGCNSGERLRKFGVREMTDVCTCIICFRPQDLDRFVSGLLPIRF